MNGFWASVKHADLMRTLGPPNDCPVCGDPWHDNKCKPSRVEHISINGLL
jgi:hypothetical protein